jgi:hypothetical protein
MIKSAELDIIDRLIDYISRERERWREVYMKERWNVDISNKIDQL